MNCSACGHESPADSSFCEACGARFERVCGACGAATSPGAHFCRSCGAALGVIDAPSPPVRATATLRSPRTYTPKHLADKILQSKSALEGERKQVTVLFADVQGSLELAEQLDPEAWHRILERFFEILTDGVHRFEGTVNQYTGDGIMALFGAPIAHEDHAQRACYAALELRTELRAYADEVRRTHGVSFSTRVGINSGEVIVGRIGDDLRMDYTAQGHTVGLAQRMESLAEPGSVFLTAHTAELVHGYFAVRSLGTFDLKGATTPMEVFELEGVGALRTRLDRSRARGFSRFIGRVREVETLEGALQRALDGRGQVVGVVANAGVGKSRLCLEFVESCRSRGIKVYEAHCPAHGPGLHLLPVFELLRDVFGITEADGDEVAREKIAGRLLLLDRSFDETLPLVWEFLGVPDPARPAPLVDPAVRQRQLFAFVRRLQETRSAREPAVLLFDDLHWIDPGSDAFVAQIVECAQSTRTLLVLNFRPEYRADWMARSYYQQLPLAVLGPDDIRALAVDLLGAHPSVAELPDTIAARTGGNPFFTEEVVQSLAESGQLEGRRGSYRLVAPIASIAVPGTVQSILAARIDRLAEREKRVLQTAAVVGKEVPESLLRAVVDLPEDDLRAALSALCTAELLHEAALYPELEYAFKHPLTHQVAYESQLTERRRRLHARVARAIEARDPERAHDNAALLAYHWEAADEVAAAIDWHRQAAISIASMNVAAAMRHWKRVHELVDRLPPSPGQRARGAEALSRILWFGVRVGEPLEPQQARRLFEQAHGLAAESDDPSAVARAHLAYALYLIYGGQEREGLIQADRAIAEADHVGDRELQVAARYGACFARYHRGEFERMLEDSSDAVRLCGGDPSVGSRDVSFGPYHLLRGLRLSALALTGRRAEAQAEAHGLHESDARVHAYALYAARLFLVHLYWLTGDPRTGLAQVRQAIEGMQEMAPAAGQIVYLHELGVALALVGEWDEAHAALTRSLAIARDQRILLLQEAETLTWLARVDAERGRPDHSRARLDEALHAADRIGARSPLPLVHFARARILWNEQGSAAAADIETELAAALGHTRELGLRLYEPFIHEELAALHGALGNDAGRREQLEHARRLFVAIDADLHAERVARELAP